MMKPEDVEKGHETPSLHCVSPSELENSTSDTKEKEAIEYKPRSFWQKCLDKLKQSEAHGIRQVPLEDRQPVTASTSMHMLLMWFSMTLATNNIVVGSMGTFVFGLRFRDAAFCAVFGNLLGAATVGYISTWGPQSGNRTLIAARYFMGYYPSKVCCVLNVFTNVGYSMVNSVVGGQILSKVSGGQISVLVGIIVVALASWTMAMFGMKVFAIYERFAWMPQLMVLCIVLGAAGGKFDFQVHTPMSSEHLSAKRISFFSMALSIALSWAPLAADYYVYYPPQIKRWRTFVLTLVGCSLAMSFTLLIGVGLGSVLVSSPVYKHKYGTDPGGLLMTAYDSLGGFGKFCAVINVLSLVANNTPGSYSMGMNFQMLGGVFQKVPQPFFTTLSTAIYTACAMGGRDRLYEVFKGFLPLIGYWVMMFFAIIVEEDVLFRRRRGYDWGVWNVRDKLPMGLAAALSFLIGWAGAILGMAQNYYIGVVARLTGGADLGLWMGAGFTLVTFPALRALEWRFIGR